MNRIVHLGLGNFHRAHQALYVQAANVATGDAWRITGVAMRSATVRDAMARDGNVYTVLVSDVDGQTPHRVDIIDRVLVAAETPDAVRDAIADRDARIVTLTVTEKGYALSRDGTLDAGDPGIAADLDAVRAGQSARHPIGLLATGLVRRGASDAPPLTVLSCDNLPDNGATLRSAVQTFARAADLALPSSTTFPNTMVDRITPATDAALRDHVAALGLPSAAPVATEAFSEWVIEDRFASTRPAWERVGVALVDDVRPYELRKLRLLNGAHSLLAYAGLNAGHETVDAAIADPTLRSLVVQLMDEAVSTLEHGTAREHSAYRDALLARFANPALAHRLAQIAMDGSQKLGVRIVPTLRARESLGLESPACRAALAAWHEYVTRTVGDGATLDDPLADELTRLALSGRRLDDWIDDERRHT